MDTILCNGTSQASHTYGNVMECIREMMIQKFPPKYFKTINTSSSMAYKSFHSAFANRTEEMKKRAKPMIVFRPIFDIYDDDMFLAGTTMTTNVNNIEYGYSRSGLCKCIHDINNHYEMDYKMNRDKMTFEVTMRVSTLHEQLNLYKYVQNSFVWNIPYFYKTALESMIPRSMMEYISKLVNLDIKTESNIPLFLKYLQSVSCYPITYKMKNASSNDEFFLYYKPNILVTLSDLDKDEGERKVMVEDEFNVTFKITLAFNLPGMYLILGDSKYPVTTFRENIELLSQDGSTDYVSIFTLDSIYESYPYKDDDGYRLYSNTIIKTDDDKHHKTDDFDLSAIFDDDVVKVIKQHNYTDTSPEIFMKVRLVKDAMDLTSGTDYTIDYGKMRLNIHNSDKDSTYRLIIYMNTVYATEKIEQNIHELKSDKTFEDIN